MLMEQYLTCTFGNGTFSVVWQTSWVDTGGIKVCNHSGAVTISNTSLGVVWTDTIWVNLTLKLVVSCLLHLNTLTVDGNQNISMLLFFYALAVDVKENISKVCFIKDNVQFTNNSSIVWTFELGIS